MSWTPAETETALWLDADNSEKVGILDSSFVYLEDISGSGRHLRQHSEALPAVDETTFQGRKSIRFNGQVMKAPSLQGLTEGGIFMVLHQDTYPAADINESGCWKLGGDSGSQNSHYGYTDGDIYEAAGSTVRQQISSPTVDLAAPHIYNVNTRSGKWEYRFNSVSQYENLTNSVAWSATTYIGGRDADPSKFYGAIAEIVITPTYPSDETRNKIEGYLAHKWGLTDGLPSTHPYKSSKPQTEISSNSAKVSGVIRITEVPAARNVKAFSYADVSHDIDAETVTLSKSLGKAISDPDTGEYTIDLLGGYGNEIFVVAFDDYGEDFTPDMTVNVGDRVHPATPNGHVFECTGSGTLPSEEPDWIIDTENSQLYGTASMIARVFYRPMVHGPVAPEVTATTGDPYFDSVTLLLHMDGTVGSTDFVDSSSTPKAMTAQGNAQIGSDGKFEQALSLGGGGDALVVTEGILYGDADLTIEAQVHPTSSAATNEIVSSSDGATFDLVFEIPTDLRLRAQIRNAANASEVNIELNSAADVIALDTWQHVALTAEGSTAKLWVNGAEVASGSITGTRGESLAGVQIGRLNSGRYFIGRMDELRITKGVARYTGAFTPPTQPFPNTAPTTTETTARYVRFFVGEAQDNTKEPCITEVWIEAPDGTQVLTKTETVTSSSDFSSSYPAAAVIDGSVDSLIASDQTDASDRWVAGGKLDQWVSVDLGEVKSIAKAHVLGIVYASSTNLPRAPKVFSIELSDDGTNWTSAYSNTAESPWTESEIRTYDLTAS